MLPESLDGIRYISSLKRSPTTAAFIKKFMPRGQEVLNTILISHVDEVDGKLVLNQAGRAVAEHISKTE